MNTKHHSLDSMMGRTLSARPASTPLRVAHMIDSLNIGGAQKLLTILARAVPRENLDLTIISLRCNGSPSIARELEAQGIRVETYPGARLVEPRRIVRLYRFLKSEKFDLLHTHLTYANSLGSFCGRITGTPVVASLHSESEDPDRLRSSLETWALRFGARRVIGVGRVVAEANSQRLRGHCLDVIPNPVERAPSLSPGERTKLRSAMGGNSSGPLIVCVGRLTAQKGHLDLLTAFADLVAAHPSAALAIAGEGKMRGELEQEIQRLGLEKNARLLGAQEGVPRLLAASDIFVTASQIEGLPLAVLEAMAAGLPVVATKVGDIPNLVSSHTGILVPPGQPCLLQESLDTLIRDPHRAKRLGEAGREHVSVEYSVDTWVRKLLSLYFELVQTKADTAPPELERQ